MPNTDNLDSFTSAYIAAALWSSNDDDGNPLDSIYDVDQIAPATLEKMIADCMKFQAENAQYITSENLIGATESTPAMRAGHDFWLTRNHHGAGFWDGDWAQPAATVLYFAAKEFGECDLYAGDDGFLHI